MASLYLFQDSGMQSDGDVDENSEPEGLAISYTAPTVMWFLFLKSTSQRVTITKFVFKMLVFLFIVNSFQILLSMCASAVASAVHCTLWYIAVHCYTKYKWLIDNCFLLYILYRAHKVQHVDQCNHSCFNSIKLTYFYTMFLSWICCLFILGYI